MTFLSHKSHRSVTFISYNVPHRPSESVSCRRCSAGRIHARQKAIRDEVILK